MKTGNWVVRVMKGRSCVKSWIIKDMSKADASRQADIDVLKMTEEWDSWKILPIKKGVPELETLRPTGNDKDYLISLVKLTGHKIEDIRGFVSMQFGDPVFDVCSVVFDNGKEITFGGEHDIAYLESYKETTMHLDGDSLRGLLMQDSDWDEGYEELDED